MNKTTLGRRAGSDGTAQQIAMYAREQARLAREMFDGEQAGKNIEALESWAEYIGTRQQNDQHIHAMWLLCTHMGIDTATEYHPGENLRAGSLGCSARQAPRRCTRSRWPSWSRRPRRTTASRPGPR